MKHRRIGYLFLFLCVISIIVALINGLRDGFTPYLHILLAFVGMCTVSFIVSIMWDKGYYIQIIICAIAFVLTLLLDQASSPYSLIFLFAAILMIYVYDIQISYYAIAAIASVFYVAAMFLVDVHNAVGMLLFSIIMVLFMHTLLKPQKGCDDE